MAQYDPYFQRAFTLDAMAPEFDLKYGLLADVLMSAAPTERFQPCARTEECVDYLPSRSPPLDSWVPGTSTDDCDDPRSADSHATAPASAFLPAEYAPVMVSSPTLRSPGYPQRGGYLPPMSFVSEQEQHQQQHAHTRMGPVAAPANAFPSIDARSFKRPKIEPVEPVEPESPYTLLPMPLPLPTPVLPCTPASPTTHLPFEDDDDDEEEDSPLSAHGRAPSPRTVSSRAARAATRGKRSPASDEDVVPYTPSTRTSSAEARRRKHAQRQPVDALLSEEDRLEKNRQSARDCRLRKKKYIESLERRLIEAEKREATMAATIARLEEQLSSRK